MIHCRKPPVEDEACDCVGPTYMVDGDGIRPVPEVMTEEEVIRMLRLDEAKNPRQTLQYYRERGLLRATRIGRWLRYTRTEVLRFLERQTAATNDNDR